MHGRRALIFIATGVVCVLAVTLGAYVVLTKFHPETEIRRMLVAMSHVRTVSERSAFSWSRGDGNDRTTTTLYATGQADLSDPSAVEHATKFRLFRLSRSKDYADLSGELRAIDGVSYLTYAPPGPDIEGADFGADDTWISFAAGELPQWGSVIPGLDAPVAATGGEDASEWTPEATARLRALLSRADVFVVRYDDLTELIDGHATRVIDGRFDPDALRSFLRDVVRAREDREPTTAERLAVEDEARALETLDVRFWIGIDDHLLYRVQAAGVVPDASAGDDADNVLVPFDLIVEFSDFDQPFLGSAPSRSLSFSDALRLRFGADLEDPSSKEETAFLPDDAARLPVESVTTSADPDQDGLTNVLEAFYRTNPRVADTDGDGVSDGDEVLAGQNPRGTGTLFGFGLDG